MEIRNKRALDSMSLHDRTRVNSAALLLDRAPGSYRIVELEQTTVFEDAFCVVWWSPETERFENEYHRGRFEDVRQYLENWAELEREHYKIN
jgi:hypothetical protein